MNVKKIQAIKNLKTGFIERNVKQWNKNSNWKSKNEPTKQIKRVQ